MKFICILTVCFLGALLESPVGALPLGNKAITRIYVPPVAKRLAKRSPAVDLSIPGAAARLPILADHAEDIGPHTVKPIVAHEGIASGLERAPVAHPTVAPVAPAAGDWYQIEKPKEQPAQSKLGKQTEHLSEKESNQQHALDSVQRKAVAAQKAHNQMKQTAGETKKLHQADEEKKQHQTVQAQKSQADRRKAQQATVHEGQAHSYHKSASIKAHSQKHQIHEKQADARKAHATKMDAVQHKNSHVDQMKAHKKAKWHRQVKIIVKQVRELKKQKIRQRMQAFSEKKDAQIGALEVHHGYGNFENHH